MNKRGLAEQFAFDHGVSVSEALSLIDAYNHTLIKVLVEGKDHSGAKVDKVSVTGVGAYEVINRAPRMARNPQTGDRIKVNSVKVVRFRPGQAFADMVAGIKPLPKDRSAASKAPKTAKKAAAKLTD